MESGLGRISDAEANSARTRLRQAGFQFVPLPPEELESYLLEARANASTMVATAELRALRENILRAAMSTYLDAPAETAWLLDLTKAADVGLKAAWTEADADTALRRSLSDWLADTADLERWLHRLFPPGSEAQVEEVALQRVLHLIGLQAELPAAMRRAYLDWVDERFVSALMQTGTPRAERLRMRAADLVRAMVAGARKGQ